MAKPDPKVEAHREWIGFIQPTGLVVSPLALVRAGAVLNRHDIEGQQRLLQCVQHEDADLDTDTDADNPGEELAALIPDFQAFATHVLGWNFSPKGYAGTEDCPIPEELIVPLPDSGETLRPDFAVRERDPQGDGPDWQLLVRVIDPGADFDQVSSGRGRLELSEHSRMERLLRQTGVPAGLLVNGKALRLISAPRGESSGWMDFKVADMVQTAGRPICSALRLLLGQRRLLILPRTQRLAALLADSRKFQNEVSERLAEQVLHALYELLRGFQAAHDRSNGELLRQTLDEHPDAVYRALLTVLLRLVFLRYAEERDMLPEDATFLNYYSLTGLHKRLREDAALHPDTMEQRYGAWAQLISLFRMIFDGAEAGDMKLPARHGVLFDPDRFPFLEGLAPGQVRQVHERIEPPLVPDGTIYRVLEKLLVLDGERISYRALDVEQIGSVYENMMGFRLETATGPSLAIKASKRGGAPTTIDLEALLDTSAGKRTKWLQDRTGRKITAKVGGAVKAAGTLEELHAALHPILDRAATPDLVLAGAMVLQPSEERRRTGSHYTPRELTEPIVRTTLEPILERLRGQDDKPPRPEQILELKVCDPAMGSGAFLVEACRQLGDKLIEAWKAHGEIPEIPSDEDESIYARRLIAQRCLYGVDRNPVAVDLARVSLWLVTLAREHPFTFLDHAFRHGDSLVGLSRRQLEAFHWDESQAPTLRGLGIREGLDKVAELRQLIREADEDTLDWELKELWDSAEAQLHRVRLYGDLVIAAFFGAKKPARREELRAEYQAKVMNDEAEQYRDEIAERRRADPPLSPFHWEIEFLEVFDRQQPGFDAFVGNPPFAGKNSIAAGNIANYPDWLKAIHAQSHGNADLVAHFFRQAFNLLREEGTFGLIATNTIAQGDTRSTGLRWICHHGGEIFTVRKRVKWPGMAAVVVSVVHVMKGNFAGVRDLDDREVDNITAFLFHRGGHDDPARLKANEGKSFQGSIVLGMGFTFDDTDTKGIASPIAEMKRLIEENPDNQEVIFPYIGGEEVNDHPTHAHHRYAINFFDRSEEECRRLWPVLMSIIESKVKPNRERQKRKALRERWWQYAEKRPGLVAAIRELDRVLVISRVGQQLAVAFVPSAVVFADSIIVFPFSSFAAFAALQSRPHEIWARFFGSTLEDRLRYTPSDCFETFPFPNNWENHPTLEEVGKSYYEFRADLMVKNDEGLTKTYNRFHDPEERNPEIVKLRELHAAMDRAVLQAYGWDDIPSDCEFLLDYEIDEENWNPRKKKPSRYRWPDEVRDEILAQLLELNKQRAAKEACSGAAAVRDGKVREPQAKYSRKRDHHTRELF